MDIGEDTTSFDGRQLNLQTKTFFLKRFHSLKVCQDALEAIEITLYGSFKFRETISSQKDEMSFCLALLIFVALLGIHLEVKIGSRLIG